MKMKRRRNQGNPGTQVDLGLRSMAISDTTKVSDPVPEKNPNGRKSRRNERNNASLVLSSEMLEKGPRGRP